MRERPIIFGAESVRAILAGRKTQTRRVVKELGGNRGGPVGPHVKYWRPGEEDPTRWCGCDGLGSLGWVRCPYGVVGDRLWIRERWYPAFKRTETSSGVVFPSLARPNGAPFGHDGEANPGWAPHGGWRSPILMPRWASRLTLEIAEVRVQRLQDISRDDAMAEGIEQHREGAGHEWDNRTSVENFAHAWDSLNAKRGYSWDTNPWVWAVTFRRLAPRPGAEEGE